MAGPNILSRTPWLDNPLPPQEAKPPQPGILSKLGSYAIHDSVPAKMVKSAWSGLTFPGDVLAGKADPMDVGRALDTAGLAVGSAGVVPAEGNELRMGVKLLGGGEAPATETGWTFRDVMRKPDLSPVENRRYNSASMVPRTEDVPINRLYATQKTVNPDFGVTESSSGELPKVVRKDGDMYVYDGHHRLVKVAEGGSQTARVNLFDFDNPETAQTPLLDFDPAKHAARQAEDNALLEELFGKPPATREALAQIKASGDTGFDAFVNGQFAGTANLSSQGHPFLSSISVEPQFQRQGIGTQLYSAAEKAAGQPLVPSPLGLSDAATAVWRKRLATMPPDEANTLLAKSRDIGRSYGLKDEDIGSRLAPLTNQDWVGKGGT